MIAAAMTTKQDLLLEIGTEELPPKSLSRLASALADAIHRGLQEQDLEHGDYAWYATPRRLAVIVRNLAPAQADKEVTRRGPAIAAAYEQDGNPTRAAQGFARSCGVEVAELTRLETDKGSWLAYRSLVQGSGVDELLPGIVEQALAGLPIAKRMRWSDNEVEFVRPVHWVVLLFGADIIPTTTLGVKTGRETRGHRFHHPQAISLREAGEYVTRLQDEGRVIADFEARKQRVKQAAIDIAQECGGRALIDEDLLDEVTALVEWPVALTGSFDAEFLQLPQEALIASMQSHQKYFPVLHADTGKLSANFITIANIDSADPDAVRQGNERVIRPRLSDAAFFWERDRTRLRVSATTDEATANANVSQPINLRVSAKTGAGKGSADVAPSLQPGEQLDLEQLGKALDKVIFQQQLGTLADKTDRIVSLSRYIAEQLDYAPERVERAARLAKCDLLSDMVGEFPELQGTMGRYYALESNEHPEVAQALQEQYMPRQAGAGLPQTDTGKALALADKLDTLTGIFAIGKGPTGAKDPFGLRRAGLGCLRIMIECTLPLDLEACLAHAAGTFADSVNAAAVTGEVFDFMQDRLRRYYLDNEVTPGVFETVAACRPTRPHDFHLRVLAVGEFLRLPEANDLVSANKRIRNILKQAQFGGQASPDKALLLEKTERALREKMLGFKAQQQEATDDYIARLTALAGLRDDVDAFFDEVMVMCEDMALRENRLALLSELRQLFLTTADISRLQ